jgi:hypothetical protein
MHKLVLATLALGFTPLLHGQAAEVYGTFTEVHGNNVPGSGTACPVITGPCVATNPNGGVNGLGPGLGLTLNFVHNPGFTFGLDLRGSKHFGTKGADTGLVGLKLGIQVPLLHLRPYIQGSGGYLGTYNASNGSSTTTVNHYYAAEVLGGVDYPLLPRIDLRVLEVGVGHALNTNASATRPTFLTASTGVAFRF